MEQNSLWQKVIQSKYGLRPNGSDSCRLLELPLEVHGNLYLDVLMSITSLLVLRLEGERIPFWEDVWVGDTPLSKPFPLLYRMSDSHGASLSSLYSSGILGWE